MPTITCSNNKCDQAIEFNLSNLEVDDSEPSGNHTTQYSGSGIVQCSKCDKETEVRCIWDQLDDTGEILSIGLV